PGTDKKKGQGFVCEPDRYKELLELPGSATECIVSHAKPGVLRPYPAAQLCRPFVDEQCEHQGDSGLLVLKNVEITMIYPRVLRNMANTLKTPLI
ncbi:MAG TPA: hypothetical protein PLN83_08720, partial [Syntrophorhabdus sp.]|nr:hypothetical protein [Syntrophorhabdus sp.]